MRLFKPSDFATATMTHDEIFERDHGKAKLEALKMARNYDPNQTDEQLLKDIDRMTRIERDATKEKLAKYVFGGSVKR